MLSSKAPWLIQPPTSKTDLVTAGIATSLQALREAMGRAQTERHPKVKSPSHVSPHIDVPREVQQEEILSRAKGGRGKDITGVGKHLQLQQLKRLQRL